MSDREVWRAIDFLSKRCRDLEDRISLFEEASGLDDLDTDEIEDARDIFDELEAEWDEEETIAQELEEEWKRREGGYCDEDS